MFIETTYWRYLQKIFGTVAAAQPAMAQQISNRLNSFNELPLAEQNAVLSEVVGLVAELPSTQELGFEMGASIPLTAFGNLTMGVKAAPTLGDALRFIADGHSLELPLVSYAYVPVDTGAYLDIGFRYPLDDRAEAVMVSAVVAAVLKEMRDFGSVPSAALRLQLTDSSQHLARAYVRNLGLQPEFGHSTNRVHLDQTLLLAANPHADAETFAMISQSCAERVIAARKQSSTKDIVVGLIAATIDKPMSLEAIAQKLNLSVRQLRFALSKDDTSYRELLRDVRITQAEKLLSNAHLNISQIAYRLGYSDVAAFSHSFQSWTGHTPSQSRTDKLAGAN
ncbi:MAG: helix-turn-helix domain-containing protein [Oceanococcus sp.]